MLSHIWTDSAWPQRGVRTASGCQLEGLNKACKVTLWSRHRHSLDSLNKVRKFGKYGHSLVAFKSVQSWHGLSLAIVRLLLCGCKLFVYGLSLVTAGVL